MSGGNLIAEGILELGPQKQWDFRSPASVQFPSVEELLLMWALKGGCKWVARRTSYGPFQRGSMALSLLSDSKSEMWQKIGNAGLMTHSQNMKKPILKKLKK